MREKTKVWARVLLPPTERSPDGKWMNWAGGILLPDVPQLLSILGLTPGLLVPACFLVLLAGHGRIRLALDWNELSRIGLDWI